MDLRKHDLEAIIKSSNPPVKIGRREQPELEDEQKLLARAAKERAQLEKNLQYIMKNREKDCVAARQTTSLRGVQTSRQCRSCR